MQRAEGRGLRAQGGLELLVGVAIWGAGEQGSWEAGKQGIWLTDEVATFPTRYAPQSAKRLND